MSTYLKLDKSIYSLEAVQKAAYRFIDRLTIMISQDGSNVFCEINPIVGLIQPYEDVIAKFKQEILDQELRRQIKEETESVRNLILSLAFSKSGLQQ